MRSILAAGIFLLIVGGPAGAGKVEHNKRCLVEVVHSASRHGKNKSPRPFLRAQRAGAVDVRFWGQGGHEGRARRSPILTQPGSRIRSWPRFITRALSQSVRLSHRGKAPQGGHMQRREFIALIGGAAAILPRIAHAQSGRIRRIGVLMGNPEGDPRAQVNLTALREGLRKLVPTFLGS